MLTRENLIGTDRIAIGANDVEVYIYTRLISWIIYPARRVTSTRPPPTLILDITRGMVGRGVDRGMVGRDVRPNPGRLPTEL